METTLEKQSFKIRNSNLELFRIIAMLFIIAHHYVVNSGLSALAYANPLEPQSIFLLCFCGFGKIGINCFVLITGYFMCTKKITLEKFLKLLFEVIFYKVMIYFIFLISGYETFSVTGLLKAFLPITSLENNFTGCFLVFYLLIPFLSILVNHLTKKQHLLLVILLVSIFSILGNIPQFSIKFSYVTWFAVLFVIASYLRLHPQKWFSNNKIIGPIALGCFLLSIASIVISNYASAKLSLSTNYATFFVSDANKLLALITGVSAFLFFNNLKIKYSKVINLIGGSTFGVLLIHSNSATMRQWLWVDLLKNTTYFNSKWLYVHAICSVIGIFAICILIDLLRKYCLEKPIFNKLRNLIIRVEKKFTD